MSQACNKFPCYWISIGDSEVRFFPQRRSDEPHKNDKKDWARWDISISFSDGRHMTAKYRVFCPEHDKELLRIWSSECISDVREEELTNAYTARKGGRI